MKKLEIGYQSQTDEEYVKAIRKCNSLNSLRRVVTKYRELAEDAYTVCKTMTEPEFIEFREGLKKETEGIYIGDEWTIKYGAVVLPAEILKAGLIACEFNVPFGCAYIRMKECEGT
jgi:hypothetical protein